jgi:hypothetical protein
MINGDNGGKDVSTEEENRRKIEQHKANKEGGVLGMGEGENARARRKAEEKNDTSLSKFNKITHIQKNNQIEMIELESKLPSII